MNGNGKKESDQEKSNEEKSDQEEGNKKEGHKEKSPQGQQEAAATYAPEEEQGEGGVDDGLSYQDLQVARGHYSETVSKITRSSFIALVAGLWVLMSNENIKLAPTGYDPPTIGHTITWVFVFCVLSMICEFLHYLFSHLAMSISMDRIDTNKASVPFTFSIDSMGKCGYRCWYASLFFFYAKMVSTVLAGSGFAVLCFFIKI